MSEATEISNKEPAEKGPVGERDGEELERSVVGSG